MITRNGYNAIVAEVEKMAILVMNNDEVKKTKYIKVDEKKYRVTFYWNASNFKSVVKVAEKTDRYEDIFEWDSTRTEKTFPEYMLEKTKRFWNLEVVEITKVEGLELGEPHQCHYNSAMYALDNDCNFVCGWYYSDGMFPIPHCINEKDGKYYDVTLNEGGKFKVYHTYTAEEISDIFDEVGVAFCPFETVYSEYQDEFYVFDGNERVTADRYNDFTNYINEMRWSA